MIRRFNYTGRRSLPTDKIAIFLRRDNGEMTFDAQLPQFDGLGMPSAARVYVEAHHQSTYMRFDFGTIGTPVTPLDRKLRIFYDGSPVNFRVKIVDTSSGTGQLLAVADHLQPVRNDDDTKREPLIPVHLVGGMNQEIWRVNWDDQGPILELNQEQSGIKESILYKHLFRSLILPEVLRSVLTRILMERRDESSEGDEVEERIKMWMKFAYEFVDDKPQDGEARDYENVTEWVNSVVKAFCSRNRIFDVWQAELTNLTSNPQ